MVNEAVKPTDEQWSALVDGELDAATVARCCVHWRNDETVRAGWHRHQVIGDVLRSEDLASDPGRDEAFLVALRLRLSAEPVVLAPLPVAVNSPGSRLSSKPAARRWSWLGSSALAAGFLAVVGLLLVMRAPDTSADLQAAAKVVPAVSGGVMLADSTTPRAAQTMLETPSASGTLVRDAGLDRYLAAHQQFAGSSALGVPSVYLRSATADASKR